MKSSIILIVVSLVVVLGAVYGVDRLHAETRTLINATLDLIGAIEREDTQHAQTLAQWSYARMNGHKLFWNSFVSHSQTDQITEYLAAIQSALRYEDLPGAHKDAKLLYERLICLEQDSLLSVGNLF